MNAKVPIAGAPTIRLGLFGPPPLLDGEDAAAYEKLLARMCAAVKPVDVIEDMFVSDTLILEWDVLRWRRVKLGLLEALVYDKLRSFLNRLLHYDAYEQAFVEIVVETLKKKFPEAEIRELARQCAQLQPDAIEKIQVLRKAAGLQMDDIAERAKARRANELAQEYARRKPEAVELVRELLVANGQTMHGLMLEALPQKLDQIERIDRLIALAETRRNAILREIDRRRAVLGEALRRTVQEVEGEFEVVETTPMEGKAGDT